MTFFPRNTLAPASLKKDWIRAGLFFVLFIGGIFALLYRMWNSAHAWRWLGLAAIFGAWQLIFLLRNLHLNRRTTDGTLLPRLGLANAVSFARGIFIAALFGFISSPWPEGWLGWLPFTFYLFAALSDILDGYLARITNHVTELGAALDMENDSWGVLIVTGLAFWYGQVPIWYLPVGLARYIFVFGLWLRKKQGKENYEMPFSFRRRIFAGVQMGFIVSMLAPVFSPPATTIAATLFMLPFLVGFLYDWLLVTGNISADKGAKFFPRIASKKVLGLIPLILRLWVAWLLWFDTFLLRDDIFNDHASFLGALWLLFTLAAIPMLFLGMIGRLGAIFALISVGMAYNLSLSQSVYGLLIGASTFLFFTGTGVLSLWSPEDWLIYNRAGGWDD